MRVFTIGYAGKTFEEFIRILEKYNINCIIDVRSTPFSKQFPDFNSDILAKNLKSKNIYYSNFKSEFGARRQEDESYAIRYGLLGNKINQVDFEKTKYNSNFQSGFKRIVDGINKGFNVCFLCSEKRPEECHRCILVGQYFFEQSICVHNIIDINNVIDQHEVISNCLTNFEKIKKEYIKKHKNDIEFDIFGNSTISIEEKHWLDFFENNMSNEEKALYIKNIEIGYIKGDEENE